MKKGFTIIEMLIGVIVLAIALLGIAAVFASTTKTVVNNFEEIQGHSIRRSADVIYPFKMRNIDLQIGWNIEYDNSISKDYKIVFLTYKSANQPDIVVVAAYKGQEFAYEANADSYVAVKNDTIISWYGFIHTVTDHALDMQNFEIERSFIVLPYANMQILDIHRHDFYP